MASDPLLELLYSQDPPPGVQPKQPPAAIPAGYTTRLSTLSLPQLNTTEPEALRNDAQSLLRSLQSLAKRSYKTINSSAQSFAHVHDTLPRVSTEAEQLTTSIPALESAAAAFSDKYSKPSENPVLDRRRKALRLNDTVDRVSNVLELPTLLQSTIAASAGAAASAPAPTQTSASANASYASALDLHAHIKRLQKLYPDSALIASIAAQSDDAMRGMTTRLVAALRAPNLKLAAAMRLVGLLRRVAPDLDASAPGAGTTWSAASAEASLGALFLVSRLANLAATLDALEPLRDLADQETAALGTAGPDERNAWAAGQQTERYLKRYIEVFREQCFAIVSMHKSIFPHSLPGPSSSSSDAPDAPDESLSLKSPTFARRDSVGRAAAAAAGLDADPLQKLPSALATFAFELVDTLMGTLRAYLPNVRDRSSRDSLLTQLLYCASSLGRLGGDFGLMLAELQDEIDDDDEEGGEGAVEWIEMMKRHRVQAGRLELLATGVGAPKTGVGGAGGGRGEAEVKSPA